MIVSQLSLEPHAFLIYCLLARTSSRNSDYICSCLDLFFCMCVCVCVHVYTLSLVQLFTTPWTVACHTPLSMEFSRQEYWSQCHSLLRGSSQPRDETRISWIFCIGTLIITVPPGKPCFHCWC